MLLLFGANFQNSWFGMVTLTQEMAQASFREEDGSNTLFRATISQEAQSFWQSPVKMALNAFMSRSQGKKPSVLLEYHGNIISQFIRSHDKKYMCEALKYAFPKTQSKLLDEARIKDKRRVELFKLAQSHMAKSKICREIGPVLDYIEPLINILAQMLNPECIGLLSSTSIKDILENSEFFDNIEEQIIRANLVDVFKQFRNIQEIEGIQKERFGFFIEHDDKAEGFEKIMRHYGALSAVIMDGNKFNIDDIKAIAKRNGWDLLVIHNEEPARQMRHIAQDSIGAWKWRYAEYLSECLPQIDPVIGRLMELGGVLKDRTTARRPCIKDKQLKDLTKVDPTLTSLWLEGCQGLSILNDLPESLTSLDVSYCHQLQCLGPLPRNLKKLNVFHCNKFVHLDHLPENLLYLSLDDCDQLKNVGTLPRNLTGLRISNCNQIETLGVLPETLRHLTVVNCKKLTMPPDLPIEDGIESQRESRERSKEKAQEEVRKKTTALCETIEHIVAGLSLPYVALDTLEEQKKVLEDAIEQRKKELYALAQKYE